MGFWSKKKVIESGIAIVGRGKDKLSIFLQGQELDNDDRAKRFKQYRNAYERVPLITAIVDIHSDQVVQDFYFEGPDENKLAKWADKINLQQFFHKIVKLTLIFGNAYVELIKNAMEITELKIIDPVDINVHRDKTGNILGYSQDINNMPMVLWGSTGDPNKDKTYQNHGKLDSIVHFKHNVIGSKKYGLSIIEPMMKPLTAKVDMEDNLGKILFKYVAPLIWAKVGSPEMPATQDVVDSISDTLADLSAESEITTSHLVDLSILSFEAKGMDIKTPLAHIEEQIITGGQVPPVLLGRVNGTANEKSAEVQLRNFGRRIKSIQRELKNEFEDNILKKQGISEENKLIWGKAEEREWEIEVDMLRGLVTDGILTPQKANSLLPPKFREKLPEIPILQPRPTQRKKGIKVTDNPNNPEKTTKDQTHRVDKSFRTNPLK